MAVFTPLLPAVERRDTAALLLVSLAALLNWKYLTVILWLKGTA